VLTDQELRAQPPPRVFDFTQFDIFKDCKRKYYLFLRRVGVPVEPAYFTAGRAWGVGLGKWYLSPSPAPQDRLMDAKAAMLQVYEESGNLNIIGSRSILNLCNLLELYTIQYPVEPFQVLGMEIGFKFPLPQTEEYYLAGSLDGYLEWPGYGMCVMEAKTTAGYLTAEFGTQWRLSKQPTMYLWALSQLLPTDQIFGCLMNYASLYIPVKPNPNRKSSQFSRNMEQRSPQVLKVFERECRLLIEDIELEWKRWEWPMTGRFCSGGYGLKPCEYRTLCIANEAAAPDQIQVPAGVYVEREVWQPWERFGNP